jgi:chromosome segregation ATPase
MARRNAFHENMDSASSLLNDYNHAEEKARQFFSQENFEKSAEVWNEAARLAALLERDDLLSRAHRHCGFSYHGMGDLTKADEARRLADEAENRYSSPRRKAAGARAVSPALDYFANRKKSRSRIAQSDTVLVPSTGPPQSFVAGENATFDIQHTLGSLESLRRSQRQNISELNLKNSNLQQQVSRLESELKHSQRQATDLRDENARLMKDLSDRENKQHHAIQLWEQKQSEMQQKFNQHQRLHEQNMIDVQSRSNEQQHALEHVQAEKSRLEVEVEKLQGNIEFTKNEFEVLRKRNVELSKQVDTLMPTASNAENILSRCMNLERELKRSLETSASVRQERDKHARDLNLLGKENESLKSNINTSKLLQESMQDSIDKRTQEVAALTQEMSDAKARANAVRTDLEKQKEENRVLFQTNQNLEEKCRSCIEEMDRAREKHETLQKLFQERESQIVTLSETAEAVEKELAEATAQLDVATNQKRLDDKTIDNQQQQLASLVQQCDDLKRELEMRAEDYNASICEISGRAQDKIDVSLSRVQASTDQAEAIKMELVKQKKESDRKLSEMQTRSDEIQQQYEQWSSVKEQVELELKQHKAESELRRDQLKNERARFGIEIGHLRREVENCQVDLSRARGNVEETQTREVGLIEQVSRLETLAREKEDEINALSSKIESQRNELEEAHNTLHETQSARLTAESRLEEQAQDVQAHKNEAARALAALKASQQEIRDSSKVFEESRRITHEMQSKDLELQQTRTMNQELQAALSRVGANTQTYQATASTYEDENGKLQRTVDQLKDTMRAQSRESDKWMAEIRELGGKIRDYESRIQQLEHTIKYNTLEHQRAMQHQQATMQHEQDMKVSGLEADIQRAEHKHKEMEEANKLLRDKIEALSVENSTCKKTAEELRAEVSRIRRELTSKREEAEIARLKCLEMEGAKEAFEVRVDLEKTSLREEIMRQKSLVKKVEDDSREARQHVDEDLRSLREQHDKALNELSEKTRNFERELRETNSAHRLEVNELNMTFDTKIGHERELKDQAIQSLSLTKRQLENISIAQEGCREKLQTLSEENTKLSVDLSVKVNETKLLQSRCDRFDEELKSCTTELQNANMSVEKMRDQLKTYEVDNARLQENNCTKTAEIERLQDETGQWKHKSERLEHEIASTKRKLEESELNLRHVMKDVERHKESAMTAEKDLVEMSKKVEEVPVLRQECRGLKLQLSTLQSEHTSASEQLRLSDQYLRDANDVAKRLKSEKERMETTLKDLQHSLSVKVHENAGLSNRTEQLTNEIDRFNERLKEGAKEKERLHQEIKSITNKLEASTETVNSIDKQLLIEKGNYESQIKELHQKHQAAMESHTRDKIERDRLYKSMQRQFEEQLDQAKEKLNADLDTVEQLRAALEKSKLNASELEGKLREEVTKNKHVTDTLDTTKGQLARYTEDLSSLASENERLKAEGRSQVDIIRDLKTHLEKESEESAMWRSEYDDSTRQLGEEKRLNDKHMYEYKSLQQEHEQNLKYFQESKTDFENKSSALRNESKMLNEKIAQLTQDFNVEKTGLMERHESIQMQKEHDLSKARAAINKIEHMKQDLQSKCLQLESRLAEEQTDNERAFSDISSQLSAAERETKELKKQLESLNTQVSTERFMISERDEQLKVLNLSMQQETTTKINLEKKFALSEQQIQTMALKMKELTEQLSQVTEEKHLAEDIQRQTSMAAEDAASKLQISKTEQKALKTSIAEHLREIKRLSDDLQSAITSNEESKFQQQRLEQNIIKLTAKLDDTVRRGQDLRNETDKAHTMRENAEENLRSLQVNLEQTTVKYTRENNRVMELTREKQDLQARLSETNISLENNISQLAKMQSMYDKRDSEVERLRLDVDRLSGLVNMKDEKIESHSKTAAENIQVRAEVEKMSNENSKVRTEAERFEKLYCNTSEELKRLESQYSSLQNKLDSLQESYNKRLDELSSAEKKVEQLETGLSHAHDTMKADAKEKTSFKKDIESLQKQINRAVEESNAMEKHFVVDKTKLEAALSEMTKKYQSAVEFHTIQTHERNGHHRSNIDGLEQKLLESAEKLRTEQVSKKELVATIEQIKSENRELELQLREATSARSYLSERFDETNAVVANHADSITSLKSDLEVTTAHFQTQLDINSKLELRIKREHDMLEETKREVSGLKLTLDEKQKSLDDLHGDKLHMENLLAQAKQQIVEKQNQIEGLHGIHMDLEEREHELMETRLHISQLSSKQDTIKKSADRASNLRESLTALQSELILNRERCKTLEKEKEVKETENRNMLNENASLQRELDRITVAMEHCKAEIVSLKSDLEASRQKVHEKELEIKDTRHRAQQQAQEDATAIQKVIEDSKHDLAASIKQQNEQRNSERSLLEKIALMERESEQALQMNASLKRDYESKINTLMHQVGAVEKDAMQAANRMSAQERNIDELEKQNATHLSRAETLQQEITAKTTLLEDAQTVIQERDMNIQNLMSRYDDAYESWEATHVKLLEERDNLNNDIVSLRSELEEKNKLLHEYAHEKGNLGARVQAGESMSEKLMTDVQSLDKRLNTQTEKHRASQALLREREHEVALLTQKTEQVLGELHETSNVLASFREKCARLTENIERTISEKVRTETEFKEYRQASELEKQNYQREIASMKERFQQEMHEFKAKEVELGREIEDLATRMKASMETHAKVTKERDEALAEMHLHRKQNEMIADERREYKSTINELEQDIRQLKTDHHEQSLTLERQVNNLSISEEHKQSIQKLHDALQEAHDEHRSKLLLSTDQLERELAKSSRLEEQLMLSNDEVKKLRSRIDEINGHHEQAVQEKQSLHFSFAEKESSLLQSHEGVSRDYEKEIASLKDRSTDAEAECQRLATIVKQINEQMERCSTILRTIKMEGRQHLAEMESKRQEHQAALESPTFQPSAGEHDANDSERSQKMAVLQRVFDRVDLNHRGRVSFKELSFAVKRDHDVADILHLPMNFRSSDGSRQTIFHILDEMESAGQDFVTWDEFKTRVLGPEYGQHHDDGARLKWKSPLRGSPRNKSMSVRPLDAVYHAEGKRADSSTFEDLCIAMHDEITHERSTIHVYMTRTVHEELDRLRTAHASMKALEQRNRVLRTSAEELSRVKQTSIYHEQRANALDADYGEISDREKQLQRDLALARREIQNFSENHETISTKLHRTMTYQESVEAALKEAHEESLEMENRWKEVKEKLEKTEEELQSLKLEYERLSKDYDRLRNDSDESIALYKDALRKVKDKEEQSISEIGSLHKALRENEIEHKTLLDNHTHLLKTNAEHVEKYASTRKELDKMEDAFVKLRTDHHLTKRELAEHQGQTDDLKRNLKYVKDMHETTTRSLEAAEKKHENNQKIWQSKLTRVSNDLKMTKEEAEKHAAEKAALESSIRRDRSMHKTILDDLKMSKHVSHSPLRLSKKDLEDVGVKEPEDGSIVNKIDALLTDEVRHSRLTDTVEKGLKDIDRDLLTFVSEEELAEEELKRIHGLLGKTINVSSPFRTY